MVTPRNRFLSRLTNRDFVVEAIEEYDDLGPDQFFDKYLYVHKGTDRKFATSTLWPLFYRYGPDASREYPSKAIAAVAFHIQHDEPIRGFSGESPQWYPGWRLWIPTVSTLDSETLIPRVITASKNSKGL
jgi:hypothetical protein